MDIKIEHKVILPVTEKPDFSQKTYNIKDLRLIKETK